jgi:23S rRNA (cytosine1962-C5)-methyltransferase
MVRPERQQPGVVRIEAEPLTGRTHQIRVHASEAAVPVLGDRLYGGSTFVRVCLHAVEITVKHPATGKQVTFAAEPDFLADPGQTLRSALIDGEETDAFRLVHGASDGWPGLCVERYGDFLLLQSERAVGEEELKLAARLSSGSIARDRPPGEQRFKGVYHKALATEVRRLSPAEAAPRLIQGTPAPSAFPVRENGLVFEVSFQEGYSIGLFLDQRDNRARLLAGHVAAGFELDAESGRGELRRELLNTFSYTCSFSVCAAQAGWRTTSLDLSRKYLEWGRRNFRLNGLDPERHDFIHGDVFDWMKRFARKGRLFDGVLLDPPTFSRSKESGLFRAERDYGKLIAAALNVLKPEGVLFASTNAARWSPEEFLATVRDAVRRAKRVVQQEHYVPQPPDFPVSRKEPAYLKTVWLRVE